MTKEKKELTIADTSGYEAFAISAEELKGLFHSHYNGGRIDTFQLTNLKVPAGGGTQWEIEGLEGSEYSAEVSGIIVGVQKTRAYYQTGFDESGGNTPPDCQSPDLMNGFGNPGGLCEYCPYNDWVDGRKECREKWRVVVLEEDSIVPIIINFPPTSLTPMKRYSAQLLKNKLRAYEAVTRFTLEKDKSSTGITYSKIKPAFGGCVRPQDLGKITHFVDILTPLLSSGVPSQEQITAQETKELEDLHAEVTEYDPIAEGVDQVTVVPNS